MRFLIESTESYNFKLYTAGYIKPDGKFIFMDEHHGEDPKYRDLKLPEFSDTHYSDDTCIRLYQEPNDIQYTKLEYIINKYLNEHGYTKIEVWNNNQHIFYEIYSLYEGACYDHHIKENVGNWTGYKLISKIKQLFNRGK